MKAVLYSLSILICGTALSCAQFIINPYSFAAPGGGGGSEPDDISGLVMWLKADSIALTDGASLSGLTWQDSSSANNDAPFSAAPTYETNELNGLPAVRMAPGTGATSSLVLNAPYTIFIVEKANSNSGNRTLSSAENNRLMNAGRDTIQAFVGGIVASGSQNTAACYATLTVPASGDCTYRQNGVDTTTGSIGFADWGTVLFGGGFTGEGPDGDVFEVIIYNTALNSTDRDTVEAYLDSRFFP
jgi:hypothetical protein